MAFMNLIGEPYRNMMGCCLVRTLRFLKQRGWRWIAQSPVTLNKVPEAKDVQPGDPCVKHGTANQAPSILGYVAVSICKNIENTSHVEQEQRNTKYSI